MKIFNQDVSRYFSKFLTLFTVLIFLYLPYYIFGGKLFVGGDDTRLIYAYPWEYLKAYSFWSWVNLSSIGTYTPNHFSLPFALLWTFLLSLTHSRIFIDYLAFSLPMIIGFIFFQKLIKELFPKASLSEQFIGALFYTLSPIMVSNQLMVFLMSAWLIGLIPFHSWALIRYIKTSNVKYVLFGVFITFFLSLGLFGLPWVFGVLMPLIGFVPAFFFFKKKEIYPILKKSGIYFFLIALTQFFWIIPFTATFFVKGGHSLGDLFANAAATFRTTVLQTSTGNITFPLLNLPNRQLIFDYTWPIMSVYLRFYDRYFFFGGIFIIVIFIALFHVREITDKIQKKLYILLLLSFLVSLFLFTVNIGPLKEIFLFLGNIPGFFMFRNAYDKFAPGFVFFYSLVFVGSLGITRRKFPKFYVLAISLSLFTIILFALPIKDIVNSPLWTTKNVYKVINFPSEYINFINRVRESSDPTGNILNTPLNIGAYSVIRDSDTNNIYAGTSPTKIFTGINDFSGDLSFSPNISGKLRDDIINRNYNDLQKILYEYNVDEIMVTRNISNDLQKSYLFSGGDLFKNQDDQFINNVTNQLLMKSSGGNYMLYKVQKQNIAVKFVGNGNVVFKKINPVMIRVYVSHLKNVQQLQFLESFHNGWELFIDKYSQSSLCDHFVKDYDNVKECPTSDSLINGDELSFFLRSPYPKNIYKTPYLNSWPVNSLYIKNHYNKSFYKTNSDGTIDVVFTIYFMPQSIFYIASIFSVVVILAITIVCLKKYE